MKQTQLQTQTLSRTWGNWRAVHEGSSPKHVRTHWKIRVGKADPKKEPPRPTVGTRFELQKLLSQLLKASLCFEHGASGN